MKNKEIRILLAAPRGFCAGVDRAIEIVKKSINKFGAPVYVRHEIVHNKHVVESLKKIGAIFVEDLREIKDKSRPVIFSAHGVPKSVPEEAKSYNIQFIDATCPLVHEIHKEVKKLSKDGRQIIVIGDHGHDEVVAIAAQVSDPIIISNQGEARTLRKMKKAGVVSQSTQMIENVQEIINILMEKVFDLRFINTICFPTRRNHEQIKELATMCDMMIVIGSFTSANSKRLTQLALERNSRSYQVTSVNDLDQSWFKDSDVVGISAGASTPDKNIKEIVEKIKNIGQITKMEEVYE